MEEIHAIEMVRHIRDTLYETTMNMSREELKAHFRHEAQRFNAAVAASRPSIVPQSPEPRSMNVFAVSMEGQM